jgi:DNA polymerase III subunit delta'
VSLNNRTDSIFESLKRNYIADRLAHAYLLITDPETEGKEFAERFLALIYCQEKNKVNEPARKKCSKVYQHTHPDILWLEPQKRSRTIQLSQIRDLQRHVNHTPSEGDWRAIILLHSDRLTTVAANTLLKTLEEPPPQSLFLLLTNLPENHLSTVLSRCQRLFLYKKSFSQSKSIQEAVADLFVNVSENSIASGLEKAAVSLAFLKNLRKEIEQQELDNSELEKLEKQSRDEFMKMVQARIEAKYRQQRTLYLEYLMNWYRDILLCIYNVNNEYLCFQNLYPTIKKYAAKMSTPHIFRCMEKIEDMKKELEEYVPEALVFERGMIHLNLNVYKK